MPAIPTAQLTPAEPTAPAEQPATRLRGLCTHKLQCFDTLNDTWYCSMCQRKLAAGMPLLGCCMCNVNYCTDCGLTSKRPTEQLMTADMPTVPLMTSETPTEQPTLGHSKWGAATLDATLATPMCHTPDHHCPHSPHTPAAYMSQHDGTLSVCKTAMHSVAALTSPSTPTPPTLHNDTFLAHAKADHRTADLQIMQHIVSL